MKMVRDMPMAEYQAVKAATGRMATTAVIDCPYAAWFPSAWNPERPEENSQTFDVGTALHAALMEPKTFSERVVAIGYKDYRMMGAREIRDRAYQEGKTPLTDPQLQLVLDMRNATASHPYVRSQLLSCRQREKSLFWKEQGIPCKCRPDAMSEAADLIIDAKTVISASPRVVARKAFDAGWYTQAARMVAG